MTLTAPLAQLRFAFGPELIVDLFAGGGGASTGIRQAFGREPDVAINHDPVAVSMHTANHPTTTHYCEDVFAVDPAKATKGLPVGLLHASPDCTHHSQARGGQPRSKVIRGLSWVVLKWAGRVRPRLITLENVEQILHWSPLVAKRDPATGRAVRLDGTVAAPGERVPIGEQFLVPCRQRKGKTWGQFTAALRAMGYAVQWRKLRACDYGAGTSRERLFLIARRDGLPIRWPKPTHGKGKGLQPFVTAADCLDWSIPCPSIFTRARPLADATLRRIARGIQRFVIAAAEPFIVECANASTTGGISSAAEPLRTVTAWPKGGAFAAVSPTLVQVGYGERAGQAPRALDINAPLGTIVGKRKHAMVAAYLEQANTGMTGHDAREPLSTIVGTGSTQRVIAAHLATLRGSNTGQGAADPLRTISAGGEHHALVECTLSEAAEAGALRVAAFLTSYYGNSVDRDPREPVSTITTKDRLALVTVTIKGEPYVIVDIGLRMLTPAELYRCQGFPAGYIYERGHDGKALTKTQQVRLVGNSVSPPPLRALVEANAAEVISAERAA